MHAEGWPRRASRLQKEPLAWLEGEPHWRPEEENVKVICLAFRIAGERAGASYSLICKAVINKPQESRNPRTLSYSNTSHESLKPGRGSSLADRFLTIARKIVSWGQGMSRGDGRTFRNCWHSHLHRLSCLQCISSANNDTQHMKHAINIC